MLPFGIRLSLAFVLLFIIPVIMGNTLLHSIKIPSSLSRCFIFGSVMVMAFMQLITVPMVLYRQPFLYVVCLLVLYCLAWILIGAAKHYRLPKAFPVADRSSIILFDLMLFLCFLLLLVVIIAQHTDADDFAFVVNAGDIVETNALFTIDPATGNELTGWFSPRYVVSPWAVYIAYYAKLTGIPAASMAHLVLPVALTCLSLSAYWEMSSSLFSDSVRKRALFMIFILALLIYGYSSVYTAETFTILRIWQGKAVVASFGIPLLLSIFLMIFCKKEFSFSYILLLLLAEFSLCLMSGMGILIGVFMAGIYGLIYAIVKRSWRTALFMWMTILPNLIYIGVNLSIS